MSWGDDARKGGGGEVLWEIGGDDVLVVADYFYLMDVAGSHARR